MIALGSEWRPLALCHLQSALDRRQIRYTRSYVPSGIRRDALFADPDAERRGRAMSAEGQKPLDHAEPPDNPDELRWNSALTQDSCFKRSDDAPT
jgi:hypothetical protein